MAEFDLKLNEIESPEYRDFLRKWEESPIQSEDQMKSVGEEPNSPNLLAGLLLYAFPNRGDLSRALRGYTGGSNIGLRTGMLGFMENQIDKGKPVDISEEKFASDPTLFEHYFSQRKRLTKSRKME